MPGTDRQSEERDLKSREYRDEAGNVHHHTHAYMEQHAGREEGRRKEDRSRRDGAGSGAKDRDSRKHAEHSARVTTDHDEIRAWADREGGKPAAVGRTHSDEDVGIIRIMFPDAPNSEHDALVEISWDDFFKEFEARQLALLHEENGMFSKIIGRDTAEKRAEGDHDAAR